MSHYETQETTREYRYEIVPCGSGNTRTFTVIEWQDNHCSGGDAHWTSERAALRAAALYGRRPDLHGRTESMLRVAYKQEFGHAMF